MTAGDGANGGPVGREAGGERGTAAAPLAQHGAGTGHGSREAAGERGAAPAGAAAIWVPVVIAAPVVAAGAAEVPEAALEALADARELADRLGRRVVAVLLGRAVPDALAASLAGHGADRVVVVEHPALPSPSAEAELAALAELAAAEPPGPVLVPETAEGRLLGPGLAVRLGRPFAGGAVGCRPHPAGALEVTCPRYEDRVYVTYRLAGEPGPVIGLRPGVAGVGPPKPGRSAAVERRHPRLDSSSVRVRSLGRRQADPRTVDLRDADRIVAVGRGVGGPDGVALAQRLADALEAALGASRVAVDLGWVPYERQVGQTGRTVAPSLYVALGISGASQHLEGMRGARLVVAVNTDKHAPIFGLAALGLVGDVRAVVPEILSRLAGASAPARGAGG